MSIEGRDYTDAQILETTRQTTNDEGQVRYEITLPSGRTITSEYMKPEQANKLVIQWCESIRAEVEADARKQKTARKKSNGQSSNATGDGESATAPAQKTAPEELVRQTLDTLVGRQRELIEQREQIEEQLAALEADLVKWERISGVLFDDV